MSTPKEPSYFAMDLCKNPDPEGILYQLSKKQYLELFEEAGPSQLCGEASATYLYSKVAADEIAVGLQICCGSQRSVAGNDTG